MDWEKNIDFNQTIHLVFDASVLDCTSYYKTHIQSALTILRNLGIIEIYIPHIVEQEHLAHIHEKHAQNINNIEKTLKKIKDGFLGDDECIDEMNKLVEDFSGKLHQKIQDKYQLQRLKC